MVSIVLLSSRLAKNTIKLLITQLSQLYTIPYLTFINEIILYIVEKLEFNKVYNSFYLSSVQGQCGIFIYIRFMCS